MDDSESEVVSVSTSGRKSLDSSCTTPPSTPQSPWVSGAAPVFPHVPGTDVRHSHAKAER